MTKEKNLSLLEISHVLEEYYEGKASFYPRELHQHIVSERITNDGKYKVELCFSAEELLKNPKCIPWFTKDFKLMPVIMFIEFKDKEKKP